MKNTENLQFVITTDYIHGAVERVRTNVAPPPPPLPDVSRQEDGGCLVTLMLIVCLIVAIGVAVELAG